MSTLIKTVEQVNLTVNKQTSTAHISAVYPSGKSAYEIAVDYGYTGTEEEWNASVNANRILAETAANIATAQATISTTQAGIATTQAGIATTKASEASASAASAASSLTDINTGLASKAPIASPTFTGTVSGITKAMVGLGNVPNTDATNPANIVQTASYRFATDTEKSTWNGKFDTPSGLTTGKIPKWGGSAFSNSLITDDGSNVRISNDLIVNGIKVGVGGGNNSSNTAFGLMSLQNNTTGALNSAFGAQVLTNNTTGGQNTGIGRTALYSNITGSNNTAVGVFAGRYYNSYGANSEMQAVNNSTFIGYSAKADGENQINQIVMGYDATGLGSNTYMIGNTSTTHGRLMGNLLLGTSTNSGNQLQVAGNTQTTKLLVNTSTDAGYQADINGALRVQGNTEISSGNLYPNTDGGGQLGISGKAWGNARIATIYSNSFQDRVGTGIFFKNGSAINMAAQFNSTGNWQFQNGGTFTDIPSARVAINSTTQGFLPPRMTQTQRNAISSPAEGLMVYQTDGTKGWYGWNGSAWVILN